MTEYSCLELRMNLRSAAVTTALILTVASTAAAQSAQDVLWDAAIAGDTAAIRQAVADGAVIDSLDVRRSINGRRALNWAAWYNHVPAVELLISLGAPLEAVNLTGFTPLHHAAEAGSLEAAVALLAAGADSGHANLQGRAPSYTARSSGNQAVADLLDAAPVPDKKPK